MKNDSEKLEYCDIEQIPIEILEEHNGRWIIWDQDEKRVLGVGDTCAEAQAQADRVGTTNMQRIHYANWSDFITISESKHSDFPSQQDTATTVESPMPKLGIDGSELDGVLDQIPVDVLREHNGKWIVWDENEHRVFAIGKTLNEVDDLVEQDRSGHSLRFHFACWLDNPASPFG